MDTTNSITLQDSLPNSIADCDIATLKQVLELAYSKFSILESHFYIYNTTKAILEYISSASMFGPKKPVADFGITAQDMYDFVDKHNLKDWGFSLDRKVNGAKAQYLSVPKKWKTFAEKDLTDCGIMLDNITAELSDDAVLQFIPPQYRYPMALKQMIDCVSNRRADSWKECANLYEEQLHRWTLEKNSEEALKLAAETNALAESAVRNSQAAAIFSGINLFFNI